MSWGLSAGADVDLEVNLYRLVAVMARAPWKLLVALWSSGQLTVEDSRHQTHSLWVTCEVTGGQVWTPCGPH